MAHRWMMTGIMTTLGAIATTSLVGLGAGMALAQTSTTADPLREIGASTSASDLNNTWDIFHRAVLAPTLSLEDFALQQRGQIATEAERFRQLQQEAVRNAAAATTPAPVPELPAP